MKYYNQTTWRTLAVLRTLSESGKEMTLKELREVLECSKSSLFPILKTMEEAGYICSDNAAVRYRLTPKLYELVRSHSSQHSLIGIFGAVSRRAVIDIQETMQMAVLDGEDIVYIAKQDSNHPVRLVSEVGRRLPSHATALGKCLLAAFNDQEIRERYGATSLRIFTTETISNLNALLTSISIVRETGYAEDWQEISEGLCCVAAPVRDGFENTVAAVSFAVPLHRATPDHWRKLREKILDAAADISEQLGYSKIPLQKAKVEAL